jgi:hypothetical protein
MLHGNGCFPVGPTLALHECSYTSMVLGLHTDMYDLEPAVNKKRVVAPSNNPVQHCTSTRGSTRR